MHYTVDPGLYALGSPDKTSPVFVSANYKMSFDHLRSALSDRNAWILVLDTKGINVWCAAGKKTFGTTELIHRVENSGLLSVVSHHRLILPQLGAPGVSAHMVKKHTGFTVIYGPIQARDLPQFIDAGMKATPEMRRKQFPIGERAALIPMEMIPALKWSVVILPIFFLLGGFGRFGTFWSNADTTGLLAVIVLFAAILSGTAVTPLLLPWLPGRAFFKKGAVAGFGTTAIILIVRFLMPGPAPGWVEIISLFLMAMATAAFLAMNFTGSTTYTSLSGVRKEMKQAVPIEIAVGIIGILLWMSSHYIA